MRCPIDISVLDNSMHNSFIEAEQHIVVKVLKTFTDETQDVIGSGNCIMGTTMETQIWVDPNLKSFCLSVEAITVATVQHITILTGLERRPNLNITALRLTEI